MELFALETWSGVIFEALSIIVLGLAGLLINWITKYVKNSSTVQEILAKEELTMIVVNMVEQAYDYLDGEEKFNIAIARLAKLFKDYGLKIDEDEIHDLIEDAVGEIQAEWLDMIEDL